MQQALHVSNSGVFSVCVQLCVYNDRLPVPCCIAFPIVIGTGPCLLQNLWQKCPSFHTLPHSRPTLPHVCLCPWLLASQLLPWFHPNQMGRVRVRQHVNPLASQFQQPTPSLDWQQLFRDPSLPLFVDMGCGPGRFLLLLARRHQEQRQHMNYLGLEIRQPVRGLLAGSLPVRCPSDSGSCRLIPQDILKQQTNPLLHCTIWALATRTAPCWLSEGCCHPDTHTHTVPLTRVHHQLTHSLTLSHSHSHSLTVLRPACVVFLAAGGACQQVGA